jgi:hypothetical protein
VHARLRGARPKPRSLLSDLAAGEFTDDVELADVASVLLEKVEQDTLQRRISQACRITPGSAVSRG